MKIKLFCLLCIFTLFYFKGYASCQYVSLFKYSDIPSELEGYYGIHFLEKLDREISHGKISVYKDSTLKVKRPVDSLLWTLSGYYNYSKFVQTDSLFVGINSLDIDRFIINENHVEVVLNSRYENSVAFYIKRKDFVDFASKDELIHTFLNSMIDNEMSKSKFVKYYLHINKNIIRKIVNYSALKGGVVKECLYPENIEQCFLDSSGNDFFNSSSLAGYNFHYHSILDSKNNSMKLVLDQVAFQFKSSFYIFCSCSSTTFNLKDKKIIFDKNETVFLKYLFFDTR
ncbi:MAG: hypothetical protein V4613_00765 [Bacteroidota bacterium]